ncbi:MAG: PAS domain S-box protein [Leptospiraceae bacterium]|nr:PAS domain S-box protein [Leptospiraceae bacterium]
MESTRHYITTVSWYNQLRIKSKALVGISIICLIFITSLSLSIHLVNRIHEETKEIHDKWMGSILKISDMISKLDSFRKLESMHILSNDENERREIEKTLDQLQKVFMDDKVIYETINADREKTLSNKFSLDVKNYLDSHNQLIESSKNNNRQLILLNSEKAKIEIDTVLADLYRMIALNHAGELESNKIVENSYYSLLFQMIITSIFTILFIYLVIYYTFKQFLFPLELAEKAANRIAKGDWKVRIEYESKDELGKFIKTFNQMVEDHRKIDAEKTRIEKEVGRNEELFRTLIEISPDAILLIGLDYSILWANNKMLRMFGYESIEEIRELHAVDFAIQEEREKVVSIMRSLLNSDYTNYTYESIAIRKDKTQFPIEIQHAIYQNENVNVGILTNVRDITERKLAEDALVENEERYRIITENMADVILILDPNTMKLLYISPSIKNLTDYSVLEIMSLSQKELLTPASLRYAQRTFPLRIKRILSGKKSMKGIYVDEMEQYKKDGTTIWTEVVSRYIINKNTGSLEVHAVMRNITERKKIEKDINEKSQMLGGILANMPVVVFRVNKNGIITQSIGAGLTKMGLMENQAININIFEVYSEFTTEFKQAFAGEPQVFISSGLYNDGIEWYFQNYFFLDESTSGLIGFGLDISEQVVAKKAAEAASKVKGDFLANISHEIRTPMNAILGFTEILRSSISDDIQKKYLENIVSSGKTLLALINDILDLSKVESGKLELELSYVNIEIIFMELKNIFSQKIEEKNLDFRIIVDQNLPREIILDELRFRQIFLNLLSNAIKFTDSGYIKLTASLQKNDKDINHMDLIFTVEDTGIGIPEEDQGVIFEAFTQQKGQSHAKYGGTGLGLAISNRLVQLMNGTISVKSQVGKGSIFQINLYNALISSDEYIQIPNVQTNTELPEIVKETKQNPSYQHGEENIENMQPLLDEMENDLFNEWKNLSDVSSINEIEEFAYKIKYLGDKYHYPPLSAYADDLQSKALLFDMKSLLILLKIYPIILNELRENAKSV